MGSYNPRKLNQLETAAPDKESVEVGSKERKVIILTDNLKFDKNGKWVK